MMVRKIYQNLKEHYIKKNFNLERIFILINGEFKSINLSIFFICKKYCSNLYFWMLLSVNQFIMHQQKFIEIINKDFSFFKLKSTY